MLVVKQDFSVIDQIVVEAIGGLLDIIVKPSFVIDFVDVKDMMEHGGIAVMLIGEAKGAKEVVKDSFSHPSFDVDYKEATGALVFISGGLDLTIKEAEEIAINISSRICLSKVIWSTKIEKELENTVKVIAIITCVKHQR